MTEEPETLPLCLTLEKAQFLKDLLAGAHHNFKGVGMELEMSVDSIIEILSGALDEEER